MVDCYRFPTYNIIDTLQSPLLKSSLQLFLQQALSPMMNLKRFSIQSPHQDLVAAVRIELSIIQTRPLVPISSLLRTLKVRAMIFLVKEIIWMQLRSTKKQY